MPEVPVLGRLRQDHHMIEASLDYYVSEYKASLNYKASSCLKTNWDRKINL